MTGIVKAGYSPHEQYATDGRLQGPWSDLYALGGTLYRAVTGSAPEEATLRVDEDRMAPAALAAKGSYRPGFLAGIDACLKVRHADRPRSVAQLRPMLFAPAPKQPSAAEPAVKPPRTPSRPPRSSHAAAPAAARPARRWTGVAAALLVVAGGAYGGYEFTRWQQSQQRPPIAETRKESAAPQQADLDAQRRRQQEAEAAQRQAAQEADKQRRETAEAEARAEADRRRQEAERVAAEAEARRKEEERRRIASREDPAPKAPPPPPASSEPAQPQGRLLKLRAKVGSQPSDAQKGWLGISMEPLELPLAQALGLANADGALVLDAMAGSPAAQSGHPAGRCRRRPERASRHRREGASPAPRVDGSGQRGRPRRLARRQRCRGVRGDAAPAGRRRQRPSHVPPGQDVCRPAWASPATRQRRCAGTAGVRTPATSTP